jgi:phosphoglycolate phosphatase
MKKFTHVLFDFDGTLADSSQCAIKATQTTFSQFGLEAPSELDVVSSMGLPIEKSFQYLSSRKLERDELLRLMSEFRREYLELADTEITIFPGALSLLKGLKAEGKMVAIVTSKLKAAAQQNAEQLGILSYIDYIVGCDTVKAPKPAPDAIHFALNILGASSVEQSVIIGDAIYDIEMGKSAGSKTCAVTWGAHTRERLIASKPDYLMESFQDLTSALLG